jgi:hypothetical protein
MLEWFIEVNRLLREMRSKAKDASATIKVTMRDIRMAGFTTTARSLIDIDLRATSFDNRIYQRLKSVFTAEMTSFFWMVPLEVNL